MPRYKPCDYNQLMMIPGRLEDQLVPGTLNDKMTQLSDVLRTANDLGLWSRFSGT
jgi:hypothetical protein